MKESEKNIEKKLNSEIKKLGGMSIKLLSTFFTGLPDRLCLLPEGRLFFIELKSTGEQPSQIQKTVHKKLAKIGFPVLVIDSTEKLNAFIKTIEC